MNFMDPDVKYIICLVVFFLIQTKSAQVDRGYTGKEKQVLFVMS